MAHPVLPLIICAFTTAAPSINLNADSKDPVQCLKRNPSLILIAQKYAGDDPHGPDPHGDDPNDEQHPRDMPSNKEQKEYKAPKDVYGGDIPNTQAPY